MQDKSEVSGERNDNKAVGDALQDLGLAGLHEFIAFVNSLSVVCCHCGKLSHVRLPTIAFTDEEIILALVRHGYDYLVVQYEEHFLGWIRWTSRSPLGTAFAVACTNCLAELLICYRAGNLVHVERMTGLSDLVSALQRAEDALRKEDTHRTPAGSTRPPEYAISGAREESTLSLLQKGTKELEVGRFKEAIAFFDRALTINPNVALVWRNKGAALSRSGAAAEAVACYSKAVELDPGDSVNWFNKGTTLHRKMARPDEALLCFDRSIEIDPTDPDVWCNKGMALHSLGRTKEEIACFDKALELNQEHVNSWLNKGITLAETGDLRAAIQCFEKVLAIDPTDEHAWFNKAATHLKLGNRGDAREALGRFIDVAGPDHPRLAEAKSRIRSLSAEPPASESGDSEARSSKDREVLLRYVADYRISQDAGHGGSHATKPEYVREANAGQFYDGGAYVECPRCHASFQFDAPPQVVLASDAMAHLCPKCRLFVVVNMMNGKVIFEGFKHREDKDGRLLELRDQCGPDALVIDRQQRRKAEAASTPQRKLWWKFF